MFGHIKVRFGYMVPHDLQQELALEKHKLHKRQLCNTLKFREAYLHSTGFSQLPCVPH